MIFLRFLLGIPVELLSFIVVPIAVPFTKERDGKNRLPKWASWWDEHLHGTDGDGTGEWAEGDNTEYWKRVRWLLRNRANTFNCTVQGFDENLIKELTYEGNSKVSNRPLGTEGLLHITANLSDGRTREEYYYVRRWGKSSRCIRIRMGWKLKDALDEYLEDSILGNRPVRSYCQFVFSPSLTMGFENVSEVK